MPDSAVQTAWKILYGIDPEEIRDPNNPANLPYYKAKKQERIDAFEHLKNGPARILFESWADKIMKLNLGLLFTPKDKLCLCPACQALREIRATLDVWVEAEITLTKEKI
jgi:hypothetical protein